MCRSLIALSAELTTSESCLEPARQAAHDWLLGRINFERTASVPYQQRQLKLDRMRQLLTRLGQPDAGMKIVHVAGTKGKGSAAAMIAAMLTAAGYRTGVFSSPHLDRVEERFAVDGLPCTPAELTALVDRLRPAVRVIDDEAAADGDPVGGPTYFEITTAIALLHFVERQVDAAVLEVGLGGRLDSTNVCLPAVSVITSISFDHTRQLGNTLEAIAREKGGIIKPGVPVVCGVTQPGPQQVIAQLARDHGCRLIQRGIDFDYRYRPAIGPHGASLVDLRVAGAGQPLRLQGLTLAMRGSHQAANAAVALAAIAELRHQGFCVSEDAIREGLSRAALPGRVEILPGEPTIVVDAAHNPASAAALIAALAELPTPSRRTIILSVSHDKDVPAIVRELVPHFDRCIVTQYQENPRAVPAEALADVVRSVVANSTPEVRVCPQPRDAWHYVRQSAVPAESVCITGSFYLAAEMRPLALAAAPSPPSSE